MLFRNEVAVLRKMRHVNVLLFMGCVSKKRDHDCFPLLKGMLSWNEVAVLRKTRHVNVLLFMGCVSLKGP
jgi:pole hole protein